MAGIAGAIVPGDGRLRFCRSTVIGMKAGDWVVIDSLLAAEPGRILFAPGDVDVPASFKTTASIARFMSEDEVARVDVHARSVLSLLDDAKRVAAGIDPDLRILNLRVSLDASTILCRYVSDTATPPEHVEHRLSVGLGRPVRVESSDRPAHAFGSLGRIRASARVPEQAIWDRLGIASSATGQFANGWPRLGSRVMSPAGTGRLLAVSVRYDTATIQLDSGERTEVEVKRLTTPSV